VISVFPRYGRPSFVWLEHPVEPACYRADGHKCRSACVEMRLPQEFGGEVREPDTAWHSHHNFTPITGLPASRRTVSTNGTLDEVLAALPDDIAAEFREAIAAHLTPSTLFDGAAA